MRTIAQLIAAGMFLVGQADAAPADTIVIRAGTIHTAEGDAPIVNGAIVVQDGKIIAVGGAGALIDVPAGTTTIDYGPDAVVVPGLVAVDSAYASSAPGPRTADPSLLAIDQFDPYSQIVSALRSGITTAYIAPSRGRLIAGQGAVIKTGGELGDTDTRVLSKSAGLHGSISEDARRTPGYWEPPVPATVDVGLGLDRAQLPRTTMGAVLAIEELIAFAKGDSSFAEEYGRNTGPELAKALEAGLVWRMGAETPGEVRALIDVAKRFNLPMVIDGASRAASAAGDIAASGLSVIARPRYGAAGDFGKDNTADWPSYDSIARLIGEGVPEGAPEADKIDAPMREEP